MGKSKRILTLLLLVYVFLLKIAYAEEFYVGQAETRVQFSDGMFVFGIESGVQTTYQESVICLYAAVHDQKGNSIWPITRFDLISGDKKWSWMNPVISENESVAFLSQNESDVLEAMATVDDFEFEIHYYTRHMVIPATGAEEVRQLALHLLGSNSLAAVTTDPGSLTGEYVLNHPVKRNHAASEAQLSSESLSQNDGKDIEK